jgi:hypothetical protein
VDDLAEPALVREHPRAPRREVGGVCAGFLDLRQRADRGLDVCTRTARERIAVSPLVALEWRP